MSYRWHREIGKREFKSIQQWFFLTREIKKTYCLVTVEIIHHTSLKHTQMSEEKGKI